MVRGFHPYLTWGRNARNILGLAGKKRTHRHHGSQKNWQVKDKQIYSVYIHGTELEPVGRIHVTADTVVRGVQSLS